LVHGPIAAPHSCPHRTPAALIAQIVAVRRRFKAFRSEEGARLVDARASDRPWPAASTIGDILKQAGLSGEPARDVGVGFLSRREGSGAGGERRMGNRLQGLGGDKGRASLRSPDPERHGQALSAGGAHRSDLHRVGQAGAGEGLFVSTGLPRAIRSDNGLRSGPTRAGGLTPGLSVWWLKLGIAPHFIPRARPQNKRPPGTPASDDASRLRRSARPRPLSCRIGSTPSAGTTTRERPHEAIDQDQPAVRWQPLASSHARSARRSRLMAPITTSAACARTATIKVERRWRLHRPGARR